MITTVGIFGAAWLLCLIAGTAAASLILPTGRWLTYWTPPVGACVLVLLLYPLSYAGPMRVVGPAVAVVLALVLVVACALRIARTGAAALSMAFKPRRIDLAVTVLGLGAGLLLLWPMLSLGMATTIAITNNDGWYYAGLVNWLSEHAAGSAMVPSQAEPLNGAVTMMRQSDLPFGLELVIATVRGFVPLAPHELVGPASAVGVPLVVAGWAAVARALRVSGSLGVLVIALAAFSPLFILAFYESYLTQFVGLALSPLSLAATIRLAQTPSLRRLVFMAIAVGGAVGVYFGLLPWLVLVVLVVFVVVRPSWPQWAPAALRAPSRHARALGVGGLSAACLMAVVVVAPTVVARAARFSVLASGFGDAGPFVPFGPRAGVTFLFGASTSPLAEMGWRETMGATVVGAALLLAVVLLTGRSRVSLMPLLLGLTCGGATALVFLHYHQSGFVYGTYKTLITGGMLIAGFLIASLLAGARGRRGGGVAALAILACALVWGGTALQLGRDQVAAAPGFREHESALGKELGELPQGSVVLADGSDVDAGFDAFQLRMMGAYYITRDADLTGVGLWTTPTYISPGPLPEFRPATPWTHVISSRPSPFDAGRRLIWHSGPYRLFRAPAVDVTQYGTSWFRPEEDGRGTFQWLGGPAELVLSNRTGENRNVALKFTAESLATDRKLTIADSVGSATDISLRENVPTPIRIPVEVPARSTVALALEITPPASVAAGDPRALAVRVRNVQAVPAHRSAREPLGVPAG